MRLRQLCIIICWFLLMNESQVLAGSDGQSGEQQAGEKGNALFKKKHYAKALNEYLLLKGQYPIITQRIAKCYWQLKKRKEAIDVLQGFLAQTSEQSNSSIKKYRDEAHSLLQKWRKLKVLKEESLKMQGPPKPTTSAPTSAPSLPGSVGTMGQTPAPPQQAASAASQSPMLQCHPQSRQSSLSARQSATPKRPVMLAVNPGVFVMGRFADPNAPDQQPHTVCLQHGYWLAETEVTQQQYGAVTGSNPSVQPRGDAYPVNMVSFVDAVTYCNKLSQQENLGVCYVVDGQKVELLHDCEGYRLPTEAEWEFAAQAGSAHRYAGSDLPDEVAVYNVKSHLQPSEVGTRKANAWMFLDMSGNVGEWVWDWYSSTYSPEGADPFGPRSSNQGRVSRGGSCLSSVDGITTAARLALDPKNSYRHIGFRIARTFPR